MFLWSVVVTASNISCCGTLFNATFTVQEL